MSNLEKVSRMMNSTKIRPPSFVIVLFLPLLLSPVSTISSSLSDSEAKQDGCATVEGTFDLAELMEAASHQCIERIIGDLVMGSINGELAEDQIDALRNLKTIDGSLRIWGNPEMKNLKGFENLTEITGTLFIGNNKKLATLDGMNNLTTVGESLALYGNESLGSLEGLENLRTTVYVDIEGTALRSLTGLEQLDAQELLIRDNASLTSLVKLVNLQNLRDLYIIGNPALQQLDGLDNLVTIDRWFHIHDNSALSDLGGLRSLTSVKQFSLRRNPLLKNLTGLENLSSAPYLTIAENTSLLSLEGLGDLNSVSELEISRNPLLENLEGLENLHAVRRKLEVVENDGLTDLTGLGSLAEVETFRLMGNNSLTSLSALANLSRAGNLQIIDNASLSTLDGLDNLTHIVDVLKITGNVQLSDISALDNLAFVGRISAITDNPLLSQESVDALLEKLEEQYFFSMNPGRPPLLPSGRVFAGESMANFFFRDHLYFGAGGILLVAEIQSNDTLRIIERIGVPTKVQDLFIDSDILYVLDQRHGLILFDLSEPRRPKLLSRLYLKKYCLDLWVGSGDAYIAHGRDGITRLDVSNPSDPIVVAQQPTPSLWVSRYQSFVYSEFNGGSIDILDATTLKAMGSIPAPRDDSRSLPILFDGEKGLLARNFWHTAGENEFYTSSLAVLDMQDPLSPKQLGQIELPGAISSMTSTSDTLFATQQNDLLVIDVSGPEPHILFRQSEALNFSSASLSHAPPYIFSSYWGYEKGGVEVLRTSPAGIISNKSSFDTSSSPIGSVHAIGPFLAAGQFQEDNLFLIDISDISEPRIVDSFKAGQVRSIQSQNDLLFVASPTGLLIFRIDGKEKFDLTGRLDLSEIHYVDVQGSLVVLGQFFDGIHLADVSVPAAPRMLSSLNLGLVIHQIAIRGNRLFVSGNLGSFVYDIADPEQPEEIWTSTASRSFPSDEGDRFFVMADGYLSIYSISVSNEVELASEVPTGRRSIQKMLVKDDYLFLMTPTNLFVYDVSDIHNISQVAIAHTSAWANNIFVNDEYIIIADNSIYIFPNELRDKTTAISAQTEETYSLALLQNYPNPFNVDTAIPFSLHQRGMAEIHIYNLAGQKVAELETGLRESGRHIIQWDGRDKQGRQVASGIYLFQLRHGENMLTRKMLLLK